MCVYCKSEQVSPGRCAGTISRFTGVFHTAPGDFHKTFDRLDPFVKCTRAGSRRAGRGYRRHLPVPTAAPPPAGTGARGRPPRGGVQRLDTQSECTPAGVRAGGGCGMLWSGILIAPNHHQVDHHHLLLAPAALLPHQVRCQRSAEARGSMIKSPCNRSVCILTTKFPLKQPPILPTTSDHEHLPRQHILGVKSTTPFTHPHHRPSQLFLDARGMSPPTLCSIHRSLAGPGRPVRPQTHAAKILHVVLSPPPPGRREAAERPPAGTTGRGYRPRCE